VIGHGIIYNQTVVLAFLVINMNPDSHDTASLMDGRKMHGEFSPCEVGGWLTMASARLVHRTVARLHAPPVRPFRGLHVAPSDRRRWVVMTAQYALLRDICCGAELVFQITNFSSCTFLCRQDADVCAIVHHQSVSSLVCRRRSRSRLAFRNQCGYSALHVRIPAFSASDQRHNLTTA
jgi:hypothetical protein